MKDYKFYVGETVTFTVEIRKRLGGNLFDPNSVKITIMFNRNIESPVINSEGMNKVSDGIYFYDWISNEPGYYDVVYVAIDGTKISIGKDNFVIQ